METKFMNVQAKTILIVDDDIYIGDMLEEVLTKEGYTPARAYSGTEALLYLSSRRPDLILLDLMLPGLSGEDLLPALARVLDEMGAEYNIFSDTMADIYAKPNISQLTLALSEQGCDVISLTEREESLESYYVNLVGGKSDE